MSEYCRFEQSGQLWVAAVKNAPACWAEENNTTYCCAQMGWRRRIGFRECLATHGDSSATHRNRVLRRIWVGGFLKHVLHDGPAKAVDDSDSAMLSSVWDHLANEG